VQVSVALLLELGVILTVLTVLGAAARRYGLSPIPLYLLAGLALGEGGIAPVPAAGPFVTTGASIGVVLLLLTLGLEFSVAEFATSLRRHLPSAAVDAVLNATPGALVGWLSETCRYPRRLGPLDRARTDHCGSRLGHTLRGHHRRPGRD
jgi:CPA2 family monovalent cation:H+ antiporter-2